MKYFHINGQVLTEIRDPENIEPGRSVFQVSPDGHITQARLVATKWSLYVGTSRCIKDDTLGNCLSKMPDYSNDQVLSIQATVFAIVKPAPNAKFDTPFEVVAQAKTKGKPKVLDRLLEEWKKLPTQESIQKCFGLVGDVLASKEELEKVLKFGEHYNKVDFNAQLRRYTDNGDFITAAAFCLMFLEHTHAGLCP